MAVGKSGRIVIEIDPQLKRTLRAALERDGLTMKEWFTRRAEHYLDTRRQTELLFSNPVQPAASDREQP